MRSIVCLGLVFVCAIFSEAQADGVPAEEAKLWDGQWEVVAFEYDGERVTAEELRRAAEKVPLRNLFGTAPAGPKSLRWTVKGDRIKFGESGFSFTLNPGKTPKEIDLLLSP